MPIEDCKWSKISYILKCIVIHLLSLLWQVLLQLSLNWLCKDASCSQCMELAADERHQGLRAGGVSGGAKQRHRVGMDVPWLAARRRGAQPELKKASVAKERFASVCVFSFLCISPSLSYFPIHLPTSTLSFDCLFYLYHVWSLTDMARTVKWKRPRQWETVLCASPPVVL